MKRNYISPAIDTILLDADTVMETLGGGSGGGPGHTDWQGNNTNPDDIPAKGDHGFFFGYNNFNYDDEEEEYEEYM